MSNLPHTTKRTLALGITNRFVTDASIFYRRYPVMYFITWFSTTFLYCSTFDVFFPTSNSPQDYGEHIAMLTGRTFGLSVVFVLMTRWITRSSANNLKKLNESGESTSHDR